MKNRFFKIILRIFLVLIIFISAVIIFFNFSHSYYVVYGPSMTPTLNEGVLVPEESKDGVFVSKIKGYGRGDIVVASRTDETGKKYVIKRVIATGGDKIKIEEIDGVNRIILIKSGEIESVILEENYLTSYELNGGILLHFNNMIAELNLALDEQGFLELEKEQVFVVGDNRPHSKDSFVYGPILKKDIVGKVDYVIYNNTNLYGQVIHQFFGGK